MIITPEQNLVLESLERVLREAKSTGLLNEIMREERCAGDTDGFLEAVEHLSRNVRKDKESSS